MNRAVVALICLFSIQFAGAQASPAVSSADKVSLLDGKCLPVKSVAEFPAALKKAFANATHESEFALADPGEPYQETDVVEDASLPLRRLEFAAHCDDRWIVYFNHGGFARRYVVLAFVGDTSPKLFWGATSFGAAKNLDELRERIRLGKVYEGSRYF